ncbi:MAG: hypothetical protein IRZ32_15695, partial [Solirubrobacteraceae bacterium]|nr:hypothetical protein [Solirubrobacteraceae bacterium]
MSTPAAPGPGGGSGAPTISPALWEQVHGRVIFDSAWCPVTEGQYGGFSVMGNRRLLITDLPAVYVYDSGGLGHAHLARLAPAVDPSATVELIDQSTRLAVDLRFPDGKAFRATSTGPLPPDVLRLLVAGLHGRLLLDAAAATFVSPCAVSVLPSFEQDPDSTGDAQPSRPASANDSAKPTSVLAKLARQLDVKSGTTQSQPAAPAPTPAGPPPPAPPPTAPGTTTGHGLPPGWTEAPTLIPPTPAQAPWPAPTPA